MSAGLPGGLGPRSRDARGGARVAVCAPNAFKGTLSAPAAARALARGVGDAGWQAIEVPVADGGDGTLDVLLARAGAQARVELVPVSGPLRGRRRARLGWLSRTVAVVEMAEAAGMRLLGRRLDPLRATSRGVGEMIAAALDRGAERIIVGVGGSASTDGGAGALQALGARIVDAAGAELRTGGGALAAAAGVDLSAVDPRVRRCTIDVAVDVFSPLFGAEGAAVVFAPQKGADAAAVRQLDVGLRNFARLAEAATGEHALAARPGAGAAGGCAFGLALLGARLVGGATLICDEVELDSALARAAIVITGEGRLDGQTKRGKAPAEVARRARKATVPAVGVCGELGAGGGIDLFDQVIVLDSLGEDPRRHVRALLREAGAAAVRTAPAASPQP